jgi:3-hydroxy-9,10-secoandrosta-1,3,5(10)-triene-9,17-dione monooxygenase reductase component
LHSEPNTNTAPADTPTADEFRHAMSYWATGVSVVTSEGPSGCTVNSLTSVSLDPLLLLVCFDRASHTLEVVRRTARFCVNILGTEQNDIARRFACRGDMAKKFAGIGYAVTDGLPVLQSAIAGISCDVVEEIPAGDHVVMLARPVQVQTVESGDPLIFYRSTYHDVAAKPAAPADTGAATIFALPSGR